MDIVIKDRGLKIYSMEKEKNNIKMVMFFKDNLCMEANSEKEFINSVTEKYTKDIFITDIAMEQENCLSQKINGMKASGSQDQFKEKDNIIIKMEMFIMDNSKMV